MCRRNRQDAGQRRTQKAESSSSRTAQSDSLDSMKSIASTASLERLGDCSVAQQTADSPTRVIHRNLYLQEHGPKRPGASNNTGLVAGIWFWSIASEVRDDGPTQIIGDCLTHTHWNAGRNIPSRIRKSSLKSRRSCRSTTDMCGTKVAVPGRIPTGIRHSGMISCVHSRYLPHGH
jgi:hypothetical protein